MRATAFFAMAITLAATAVGATSAAGPVAPRGGPRPRVFEPARAVLVKASSVTQQSAPSAAWAAALAPVEVSNKTTRRHASIRLYGSDGSVDRAAARSFMRVAGRSAEAPDDASEEDERLDLRLVQLVVRASYRFGGAAVQIVSATRSGTNGKHASGEAIDFALEGVRATTLAAYLRTTPRAGVGIYTHPKTQYVHLDVREQSFHWIDASPPGVSWREQRLPDAKGPERDASYGRWMDLPEAAHAP